MTTTRGFWAGALGLLLWCAHGCASDGDGKGSCVNQDNCQEPGGGDGGTSNNGGQEQFGSVQAMSAASLGLAALSDDDTLVAMSTASGELGCAMVGDEEAAPGGTAASVTIKIDPVSGDDRCPDGTFDIFDDLLYCGDYYPETGLNPNCAVYRAWDASGDLSAFRLATGGYLTVTATQSADEQIDCDVDLSVTFAGGVTIADAFSFTYDPLATDGAFCQH